MYRLANVEIQLPGLVATKREAGAIVALDPYIGTEFSADIIHQFQRRRCMPEVDAGEIFNQ